MSTLVLDAYSKAYPFITNRIRASVFLENDPLAPVASIIDNTAGHPQRIWHFPGLSRNNYGFSLDEINGSDIVISNLALFDVVPGQLDGTLCRDDEQIIVDVTPGLTAGENFFIFDGTAGKPNFIGWEIVIYELGGRAPMARAVDYSWNKDTGRFDLLLENDIFAHNQIYNVHFNCIEQPAGNSYPTLNDFGINIITASTTLDNTYFGNKLLIEPASTYIEVTLPDINTVVQGRPLMVEVTTGADSCVKFKTVSAQIINFLRGNLYALPGESFWIYKLVRGDGSKEWRVSEADGNFKTVGQETSDDMLIGDLFNKHMLDGSVADKFQYARIYNEVVLNLPGTQVVNYDEWSTGNNKYLFSLANSADVGNANKFHFPDRRGMFERNNNAGKAGDFEDESVKILPDVQGVKVVAGNNTVSSVDALNPTNKEFNLLQGYDIVTPGASETRPSNYKINKYILI